jgi:hypothetical protein
MIWLPKIFIIKPSQNSRKKPQDMGRFLKPSWKLPDAKIEHILPNVICREEQEKDSI